ncbi:MAG: ABC transporter ATP-binding protein, partial [Actinobacteria bacterium]|nr:ABC transporter ATP-binding protein [Actinomycetota bacterium]
MTALEASAVSKRYRAFYALRDCNLGIPAGTVTALVGPNGAGKSTLLHLAVGLRRPTSGNIRVLDGLLPGSPTALPGVGFVAQDAPLYLRMSVAGLLHVARNLNPVWDGAYAVRRIDDLGIPLNARVGSLPGGHQAQLALTVALAKRPRLLLLDEPLARLDPLARHEFLSVLMAAVAADGMSVIFSSHVLAELERVCDYLVLLSRGRVQLAGAVDAVLAGHRVLTGPPDKVSSLPAALAPIRITESDAQAHLLVRTNGRREPLPPEFDIQPAVLEELVLAYLGEPDATALPGP